MSIQINPILSPRIITVPEADGDSITIQSLVNQIRNWEDNQVNLAYNRLLSATGKEDLGNEIKVGITATLENVKVKFAERLSPVVCYISGGNLVAIDEYGSPMYPIKYSTNVTVVLAQSSSATLLETGVSGLTSEESVQLMNLPTETITSQDKTDIAGSVWGHNDASLILKILKNKRIIKKTGLVWELTVYDDDNYTVILNKVLKDKNGNDITDLVAGALAQELATDV